jgi:MFS family permease
VFLLGLLTICVATVPLAGGRLGRLSEITFRRSWAGLAALLLQFTILRLFPVGSEGLLAALHLASYGLMFYFLAANLSIPGLWLIGIGGSCNALAIAANNGVMPALPEALATAGIVQVPGEFANSAAVAQPKLWFLGDVFALPAGWPMANVFSVGDLILLLGAFVLLHRQCRSLIAPQLERLLAWAERTGPRVELLRANRAFRRLWIAQAISSVGDWIFIPAVYAALVHGDARASDLALLLIAQVGPGMIVGFFGGPFIDRFSRKWLMVGTDALRAVAVGSLLFGGSPSLTHVYAVSLMLGVGNAVFQPAFLAAMPNLVPKRNLASANAFVGLTQSIAIMVGFPLGGFIVDQFGVSWGFTANAVSFGFAGALVAGTIFPKGPAVATQNLVRELREGFRYVRRSKTVRSVILVVSLITLAAGIKSPLEPLFALDSLDAGIAGLGLLGAVWGGGMMAGSLVASLLDRRLGHAQMLTTAVGTVAIAVMAASLSPTLAPVAVLWVAGGVANTLGTVAYETLLQERTEDAVRGRVMAALEASLQAGLLVGVGLAALTDRMFQGTDPARAGMALAGGFFGVAAFASWFLLQRKAPARRLAPLGFSVHSVDVVPAGAGFALVRVNVSAGADKEVPYLLIDDGTRLHRLKALPGAGPDGRSLGYGVPRSLLSRGRSALALEVSGKGLLDLPRPAL